MARRPRNYLNNKDLLDEIRKSKNTYSSYVSEGDEIYDIILPSLDRINIRTIAQAKRNKADRLSKRLYEERIDAGDKVKMADVMINWKKIKKHEVIFRITSFDHIPLEPGRKKTPKTVADHHTKLNFPPFQHFKFDEEGNLHCIGKSHWIGGMENGHYSKEHGNYTRKLAEMYVLLCERFGTRGNWRGYTYNDEMKAESLLQLVQVGLQFDESKSQNPFAYYTRVLINAFTKILNNEKKGQDLRDDILEMNNLNPSYTRQAKNDAYRHDQYRQANDQYRN